MFMTRDLATGLCRPAVTFRGQCPTLGRLRRLRDRLLLLPDSGLGLCWSKRAGARLHVNDAAFHSDHGSVGSVVGAQLG